jgi:lipopolysaccharide transport system permease protein
MQTAETITKEPDNWLEIIKPKSNVLDFKLRDIWRYRDLLTLLVRRDFIATYKQTILGPIWFFLQPILTTIMFALVFGRIAGIPTDGVPMILFYLSGLTLWNYFAECLNKTATVLKDNAEIFGKVYFPRIVMPLSIIVSNLLKLCIQLILFLVIWSFYLIEGNNIHPNFYIALVPYLIILMGGLGLGFGMIITSLTTKYRDLVFLLTFGVQLLMYATPVIYPLSNIHNHTLHLLISANPMTSIIETFRFAFLGKGSMDFYGLAYSTAFMILVLVLGMIIFNKVEKSFMDTV